MDKYQRKGPKRIGGRYVLQLPVTQDMAEALFELAEQKNLTIVELVRSICLKLIEAHVDVGKLPIIYRDLKMPPRGSGRKRREV